MIRLQFVTERAWTSWLIGAFGAGHLSHVDAIMPDGSLLGARYDSIGGMPPGVQIRPPNYAKFSRRVIAVIPASEAQESAFYAFLHQQLGKPYDWRAIFAFAINRDWRAKDSWICSEFQAAALEASTIVSTLYLDANKIVPVPLALAVSAIPGVTMEILQ
jgi:uncharacterized protein YycO